MLLYKTRGQLSIWKSKPLGVQAFNPALLKHTWVSLTRSCWAVSVLELRVEQKSTQPVALLELLCYTVRTLAYNQKA